jgi:hypothetical protein
MPRIFFSCAHVSGGKLAMNGPPALEHANTAPPASLPQSVRTLISFLLFLHLFALGVAVASNAGPVSPLRRALRRAPFVRPYLQWLQMDLAYNYHLTFGSELDCDHFVEIELDWKGRSDPRATTLALPEQSMWPRERVKRYHNLTLSMASFEGQSAVESLLPHAVSRRLLAERGITSGAHRFRLRRHMLLPMQDAASTSPAIRDPFGARRYQTALEYDLAFARGELLVSKAAEARETAPVEGPR